jgi:hypothetical protein
LCGSSSKIWFGPWIGCSIVNAELLPLHSMQANSRIHFLFSYRYYVRIWISIKDWLKLHTPSLGIVASCRVALILDKGCIWNECVNLSPWLNRDLYFEYFKNAL